ncbi:MAG: hypothetical protein RBS80_08810 [Thermoguttaceae bacterium]|jgi:hypothetical protein|nr:hypothetical protein [Thermoguttaceae bacterium]
MDNEDGNEADVEEVVTEFDEGIRVRSGFQIEEVEPGVLDITILGPFFEVEDEEDKDLEDEDDKEKD